MADSDPLVEEIVRARRDRRPLVIAAVIGIVTGAALGMGFTLGALGSASQGTHGLHDPAALLFFIGPPIVSVAIGYAMVVLRRRRR
jgi:hypothetical protein